MARIARMCYESNYFHIMVQGIERKSIFSSSECKEKYYEFLNKSAEKNNVKIIAYCIMDNHVHLLLYTEAIRDISKIMASTNTKYAKYYNKIKNRCGYVYRDRYRCENIMTENHLLNCIRYIHNNPVKSNICQKQSEYQYSSYNLYKNKQIDSNILKMIFNDTNEYMCLLGENIENYNFIDVNNEFGEKKYEKIEVVFEEYKNLNLNDEELMYKVISELKRRCNVKNEEIIEILNINKSKFYRVLKKYNKK